MLHATVLVNFPHCTQLHCTNPLPSRYIRSNVPLDELELRARYPPVDAMGREKKRGGAHGVAGAYGQ